MEENIMNEKIKELMSQAGYDTPIKEVQAQVLAELIIKECIANIGYDTSNWQGDEGLMAYYQGVQDAIKSMKKHFGVE